MLDWIGTKILALMTLLPAVFVDEKSPNFTAIRAMFGLGFIVLVAYLIAMRPFRSTIVRCMRAMSNLAARKRWSLQCGVGTRPARSHPDRSARRSARGDDQCTK
jgi:hypothetical protein